MYDAYKETQFSEARYKRLSGDGDLKESHNICKEFTAYLNEMDAHCLR